MSNEQEKANYERNKESNLRYILAKLPGASTRDLALIAAFISGLGIYGWSGAEYQRSI